jgi:hypothetical protein
VRQSLERIDELYLAGFGEPDSCSAIRRRRCSLIVPGGLPVAQRIDGDALTVLHTVVCDWPPCWLDATLGSDATSGVGTRGEGHPDRG